jgi:hypothetical protein
MSKPVQPNPQPARVLMYTAYFDPEYSGAALQALTLARELRQRGHHVEFVTNRWPGLAASGVVDGFPVQRLEPGRWRKHREFRLWFNLARYVWRRRHDFDILHSHGAYYTHAFIGPRRDRRPRHARQADDQPRQACCTLKLSPPACQPNRQTASRGAFKVLHTQAPPLSLSTAASTSA